MNAQEESKRRTLKFTFAGIGFLYLVAFGGIVLLMSAAKTDIADLPPRPVLALQSAAVTTTPVPTGGDALPVSLELHWSARHKDAAGPWTIDAQGQVYWR